MRFFSLLLVLLVLAPAVMAQQVLRLGIDDAIEIALENNVDIMLSKSQIERSESQLQRSRADFLPNLNASMGGSRLVGRQFDQVTATFGDFTTHNFSTSLSTNVILFNGFRNINELRSSRLAVESSEQRYERMRENVIFQTAAQFLDLLLAMELLEIGRENLEASLKQLEQVTAQVEVGMRPIVDQFTQESIVANNELNVIRSENALELNKLRLLRLLAIDPLTQVEFIFPSIDEDEIVVRDYDLREMIQIAMMNRRDVRASELELRQAEYAMRISEGARMPTMSFSGSVSSAYRDRQRDPLSGDRLPFGDQFFDANINRGVSFNVSVPIFNRLQTRTQIQQRQIDFRNAELQLEDLRQEVYLELQQAYNDYMGYVKEMEATEKAFIAAEKAYQTALERYNVGSATLIELTNANNEFIQASSNRIQVMYQFIFQEKVLDFFLGRITEDVAFDALD